MSFRARLLALALVGFAVSQALAAAPIQAWFGPRPAGSPDGLDTRFVEFVKSATKTLDCCFYELRLDSIVDALVEAKGRGVRVRFIVDDSNYYGKDELGKINKRSRNPFIRKLIKAKIEVKQDADRRALMHNKYAIADSARVWTGSYNLTDTCSYNNANNALWLEGPEIASVYEQKFSRMFDGGEFGTARASSLAGQTVKVGEDQVEVLFAPEDDPQKRQIEILKGARHAICFMQFAFTSSVVSSVLVEKARKENVTVKGIFDHRLYRSTGPYGEFSKLTAAKVPVVVWSNPAGKFHHKVFIVDPGEEGACVITGSENTSNNGNSQNDENVVVIRNKEIVARYFAEFERLFGTTARTSAELIYSELPVAGSTIDEMLLYVYANGQPVKDVQVEFPARWPISPQTVLSMAASIDGKPLAEGQMKFGKTRASFTDIGLEPTGPRSLLVIRLESVNVPVIPGGYSPLVAVTSGSGNLEPVASQPFIEVFDPKSPDFMVHYCETLKKQLQTLSDPTSLPGADLNRFKKAWQCDFDRLRRSVVSAAASGLWTAVAAVVTMLESLDPGELTLVMCLTGNLRDLKQSLTAASLDTTEAKALLDRITKLQAKGM